MVLSPKRWKSRSSPGFMAGGRGRGFPSKHCFDGSQPIHIVSPPVRGRFGDAGWSSPVARQAHNLKVAGSNPAPATNKKAPPCAGLFLLVVGALGFERRSAGAAAGTLRRSYSLNQRQGPRFGGVFRRPGWSAPV